MASSDKSKNKSKKPVASVPPAAPEEVLSKKSTHRPVGQALKKARLEKGWRLANIVQHLNISQSYIQAIENGDLNELPKEQTYTIGFVKAYAQAVDLPPQEIVDRFKKEHYGESDHYNLAESQIEEVEEDEDEMFSRGPNPKMLWGSLGVAAAAILIGYLVSKSSIFDEEDIEDEITQIQKEAPSAPAKKPLTKPVARKSEPVNPINKTQYKSVAKPVPLPAVITPENPNKEKAAPLSADDDKGFQAPAEAKGDKALDHQQVVVHATEDPVTTKKSEVVTSNIDMEKPAQKAVAHPEPEAKSAEPEQSPEKKDEFVYSSRKLPIVIGVTDETWIEVRDPKNDDLYLSKVVQPGFKYQVPVAGLEFATGDASTTTFEVEGQKIDSLMDKPKVLKNVELDAKKLKDKFLSK